MNDIIERVLDHFGIEYRFDGTTYKMRCPLHDERTPSLGIHGDDGRWYCFGCRRGGGLLAFVEALSQSSFEALLLIHRLKRDAPTKNNGIRPADDERRRRRDVSGADALLAWKRFHPVDWMTISSAHPVARYLFKRGFTRETLQGFNVKMTESAEYPVAFPVVMDGTIVGYVKRRIDEVQVRKYLYNDGFSATRFMSYAKIDDSDLLVVEGVLDFMKAAQFGYKHIAALLSWRVTDEQAEWLKARGVRRVISGLDNTPTGEEGTDRLCEFFDVRRFMYPGRHKKDIGDLDVAQFWMGVADARAYNSFTGGAKDG